MSVEWEEPPDTTRGGPPRDYSNLAAELRAHPGKWAVLARDAWSAVVTRIRRGDLADFPAGEFEVRAVTSGKEKNRADIYIRYIGKEEQ